MIPYVEGASLETEDSTIFLPPRADAWQGMLEAHWRITFTRTIVGGAGVAAASILIPLMIVWITAWKNPGGSFPVVNGAILRALALFPWLPVVVYFAVAASLAFSWRQGVGAEGEILSYGIFFLIGIIAVMATVVLSLAPRRGRLLLSVIWVLIACRFLFTALYHRRDVFTLHHLMRAGANTMDSFSILWSEYMLLTCLCGLYGLLFFGARLHRMETSRLPRFAITGDDANPQAPLPVD
jgi:hypothetical protein